MPSVKATASQVRQLAQELLHEVKRTGDGAKERIVNPKILERQAEGATRAGQVTAVLFLPFIMVVSFTILKVMNSLMANVLGSGSIAESQVGIVAFLVTGLTLALLIIVAWGWFQWVKTAGFGAFTHE